MNKKLYPLYAAVIGAILLAGLVGLIEYVNTRPVPLMTDLNGDNFKEVINGSKLPLYIEFYSKDCDHCKKEEPIVAKLATEFQGKVRFCRVDMDENKDIVDGIKKVPAHLFLNKRTGKQLAYQGYLDEDTLRRFLEAGLNVGHNPLAPPDGDQPDDTEDSAIHLNLK